jgi:hypothetical protein
MLDGITEKAVKMTSAKNKRQAVIKVLNKYKNSGLIINDKNAMASFLISDYTYFNNSLWFYEFFGLQGGTIWQLIEYIKVYLSNQKRG